MLTGVHFLLTYQCNIGCDHCFLYCGPHAEGTFTLAQIERVLQELPALGTVESVCFEGGEPFLHPALLLAGVERARMHGFKVGIVTNASWATSDEDAERQLRPLVAAGLGSITVSDDALHFGEITPTPAQCAMAAAQHLGMPSSAICIERPTVTRPTHEATGEKGEPVVSGGVMFRGRAAELLATGLPRRLWEVFDECPHENLRSPKRVHLDPFGHVHLCQGLLMGNMWETPFAELVRAYDAETHPIAGPLVRGGPAELARTYGVAQGGAYVDACHLCYTARRALLDRFPRYLAPKQVYGY